MKKTKFLTVLVLILLASILLVSFSACNKNVEEEKQTKTDYGGTLCEYFETVKERCIAPHIFNFRYDFDFYGENIDVNDHYWVTSIRPYRVRENVLGAYQVDGSSYANDFFKHIFVYENIRYLYSDYDFYYDDDLIFSYGDICYQVAMIENGVPTIEEIKHIDYVDWSEGTFYSDDFVVKTGILQLFENAPKELIGPLYEFAFENDELSAKCYVAAKAFTDGKNKNDLETLCRIIATETIDGKTYRYVVTLNLFYEYEDESSFAKLNELCGEQMFTISEEKCRNYATALMEGFVKTA